MSSPELRRNLTFTDVVALGVNGVIGSGIFLLPGIATEKMGPAALVVTIFGGFLCFLIALCFAETGSYFSGTGGPYLYARTAFGRFAGFQVGWMTWWVRVISWAALANGFAIALSHFMPWATTSIGQPVVACTLIIGLAAINFRGSKQAARLTTVFTVAKLVPLAIFIAVGVFFIEPARFTPFAPHGYGNFAETTVTLLYAYVGFEVLAVPAGEMKDPQKAVPIALVVVLTLATVVYMCVMSVSIGTLEGIAGAKNPVADASAAFMGGAGGALIAGGIVISVFGVNAGSALITPRCLFALAENGQLPKALARVHPRFETPHIAIVVSTVTTLVLALSGSFKDLAIISVVARFVQYIPTCIAAIVLRRKGLEGGGFRLPLGPTIPLVAVALSLWLLAETEPDRLIKGSIAFALGLPFYFWLGRKG